MTVLSHAHKHQWGNIQSKESGFKACTDWWTDCLSSYYRLKKSPSFRRLDMKTETTNKWDIHSSENEHGDDLPITLCSSYGENCIYRHGRHVSLKPFQLGAVSLNSSFDICLSPTCVNDLQLLPSQLTCVSIIPSSSVLSTYLYMATSHGAVGAYCSKSNITQKRTKFSTTVTELHAFCQTDNIIMLLLHKPTPILVLGLA